MNTSAEIQHICHKSIRTHTCIHVHTYENISKRQLCRAQYAINQYIHTYSHTHIYSYTYIWTHQQEEGMPCAICYNPKKKLGNAKTIAQICNRCEGLIQQGWPYYQHRDPPEAVSMHSMCAYVWKCVICNRCEGLIQLSALWTAPWFSWVWVWVWVWVCDHLESAWVSCVFTYIHTYIYWHVHAFRRSLDTLCALQTCAYIATVWFREKDTLWIKMSLRPRSCWWDAYITACIYSCVNIGFFTCVCVCVCAKHGYSIV